MLSLPFPSRNRNILKMAYLSQKSFLMAKSRLGLAIFIIDRCFFQFSMSQSTSIQPTAAAIQSTQKLLIKSYGGHAIDMPVWTWWIGWTRWTSIPRNHTILTPLIKFSLMSAKSLSTIILTNCSNVISRSQPSFSFALEQSPSSISTSAGLTNL